MQEVKIGTYAGNGSNQSVIIGFPPDDIEAWNASEIWKWRAGMSSGAAMGIRGATGSLVRIESLGFSPLSNSSANSGLGFLAQSSVNQSSNTYYYRAMRNG